MASLKFLPAVRPLAAIVTAAALLLAAAAAPAGAQRIEDLDLFLKSQKAAQKALEHYGRYDDATQLERVAEIGYRLAQESTFRDFPFTFYLVDMPEPNAFALPGGQIFLTHGMLDLGLTDDMLAGLLGHEIGHVILSHGLRLQKRATLLNVISQALLVGVLINASQKERRPATTRDPYGTADPGGDLIEGTAAAGAVVSELLMRSYSREFEDEADDEGQRLAAAAGFDPDGTRQLMDAMRARMPQSREYGYWRTHPFFEERVKAAGVREELLKIQEPRDAGEFRARTQAALLSALDRSRESAEVAEMVKEAALLAWPQGPAADEIRLERVHARRAAELEKTVLRRDYGSLIDLYREHLEKVRSLTPESPLVATLEAEVGELIRQRSEIYPEARKVLAGGVYETEFLETFLSNFPTVPEAPSVALALGEAYSRLGQQSEAIEHYLQALERAPEAAEAEKEVLQEGAEPGGADRPGPAERARIGLRNLTPVLRQLDALQRLASQEDDPELARLAEERLAKMAREYKELSNGATYLRQYPNGSHAQVVAERLNLLADQLYGEVVLYQAVGDHVKGIERIQKILTYAPDSPAAERLRDRMVVKS